LQIVTGHWPGRGMRRAPWLGRPSSSVAKPEAWNELSSDPSEGPGRAVPLATRESCASDATDTNRKRAISWKMGEIAARWGAGENSPVCRRETGRPENGGYRRNGDRAEKWERASPARCARRGASHGTVSRQAHWGSIAGGRQHRRRRRHAGAARRRTHARLIAAAMPATDHWD
jgi:hypothetical protein